MSARSKLATPADVEAMTSATRESAAVRPYGKSLEELVAERTKRSYIDEVLADAARDLVRDATIPPGDFTKRLIAAAEAYRAAINVLAQPTPGAGSSAPGR